MFIANKPSQSLYKNSFHTASKEEIQKPPRIDKLNVRKFDPPGKDERYMKFPQLRQAKINTNLKGYRQVN